MNPEIILENENFLAVNKPAGLLVHSAAASEESTLVDWLVKKYPEIKSVGDDPENRPGIVHRLDKDTSGVILIARNQRYFDYLKKLFQNHQIKKTYWALVWGEVKPAAGEINKPIAIKSGTIKRTVFGGRMEKEAITEYKTIKKFKEFSLLEVFPKTGRTHQIRIHLASIYHPVVGDQIYGKKENPFRLNYQFLHARSLEFSVEPGRRIKIEADLPEDLQKILDSLGKLTD